jgi:hypothetical protein
VPLREQKCRKSGAAATFFLKKRLRMDLAAFAVQIHVET